VIIAVVMAIVDCHIGLIVGKWLLSVGMGDDSFRFDSFIRIDRSVVAGVRVWSLFILFFGELGVRILLFFIFLFWESGARNTSRSTSFWVLFTKNKPPSAISVVISGDIWVGYM